MERNDLLNQITPGTVALVGIPFDGNSSFMAGPAEAPPKIRETFRSESSNMSTETLIDLGTEPRFRDLGDIPVNDYLPDIEQAVSRILMRDGLVLALGGDHSVTYPILRAYGKKYKDLSILQFDAHPDLYDEYEGNRYAHGCPFARIMEENLARRLVQVGIRTMNSHQYEQARRYNVQTIAMKDWKGSVLPEFEGPIYISLDMDVLDPAFAPGVSHHEAGGFSTRELLAIIHGLGVPVVGADIVEYNPRRDPLGITAAAAAKFLKEIAGKMLS
ncbi:MAG: agmatinase [bacterium]|nr:agmatinase [bacterium]